MTQRDATANCKWHTKAKRETRGRCYVKGNDAQEEEEKRARERREYKVGRETVTVLSAWLSLILGTRFAFPFVSLFLQTALSPAI